MTGPQHYIEAERLLANTDKEVHSREEMAFRVGVAQAHATLALAAATAEAGGLANGELIPTAWEGAIS